VNALAVDALRGRGAFPDILPDEAQVVLADASLSFADLDTAKLALLDVSCLGCVVDEEPVLLRLDQFALFDLVPGIIPA
jgi:hypothetical protein